MSSDCSIVDCLHLNGERDTVESGKTSAGVTAMTWEEIRKNYPDQWLIVEALLAHSEANRRIVEKLTVVEAYPEAQAAMSGYLALHRSSPSREFYVAHTSRPILDIEERSWLGLRKGHEDN